MTNEEAVKMLRTMRRTVYLGNRKYEDAIECAIKALSEPFQPWEVLAAQAVLSQPAEPKRGRWHYSDGKPATIGKSFGVICDQCGTESEYCTNFCGECGADMREVER